MSEQPEVEKQPEDKLSKGAAVSQILALREQLKKQNEARFSGAAPMATATMLLDKSEAERLNPEHRVRWVSLKNAQKAIMRQASGYERISAEEGGRQVGDLALMRLPAEEHARRVERIKMLNRDRLSVHNKEAEQMAEAIAKELRDRHGISVSAEKIFGEQGGDRR